MAVSCKKQLLFTDFGNFFCKNKDTSLSTDVLADIDSLSSNWNLNFADEGGLLRNNIYDTGDKGS
jgi:hypothetical protein